VSDYRLLGTSGYTSNSCLRFSRDKSSVTLLTDPAFLGKNQIPDKGAEPIYIPALPQDSDSHIQVEMVLTERSDTPFLIGIKSLLLVLERKEAVLVK
jgi:hypothetical protein